MIQVADAGVGISGQEGMQVMYTKTAAHDIRFHFKLVKIFPWRPSGKACTQAGVCSLSSHPGLSALPGALRSWMLQGFRLQTAELACHRTPCYSRPARKQAA